MHWFESSKEKQFRQLIESNIQKFLTKPQKYEQAFAILESLIKKSNQEAIEIIVNQIKQIIKDSQKQPIQKYRSIILLRDLMESRNKNLGKYVVKKILKRLTILAQHRKNQKDQNRGLNIFKCKKSQQKYGIQFLKILLLCLEDWGKNWPRHADGPFHDFYSAYNELLMEVQVTFPSEPKKTNKSPVQKNMRKDQNVISSANKIPHFQKQSVQYSLSKPVIKEKMLLTGPAGQYVNQLIQLSQLLATTLTQNPQFSQIWDIIKAYVDQYKQLDERGNFMVASIINKNQQHQNTELLKSIQQNSNWITQLIKDTGVVDRKNQSYKKFYHKYIQRCKKLIVSLSIFTNKIPTVLNNSNNISQPSNSNNMSVSNPINESVNQQKIVEQIKPKANKERNRYGSSFQLRNQLQINLQPINKEDFNSGTHKPGENSDGSNRFNSVNGVSGRKDKEVQRQKLPPSQSNQQSQYKVNSEMKGDQTTSRKVSDQQNKLINPIIQNNEQNNFNKFDFQNDPPQTNRNNISGFFGDFDNKNQQKINKQDSNSQFFKDIQIKQENQLQGRRNKKLNNKKRNGEDLQDFFDNSIKNKCQQPSNLSQFNKQKVDRVDQKSLNQQQHHQSNTKSLEKQQQKQSNFKPFDTFKNPQQIAQAMEQLKKSDHYQNKMDLSNPFEKSVAHQNPFDNPFQTHIIHNTSFNSQNINNQNPFTSNVPKTTNNLDNPFEQNKQNNINNNENSLFTKNIGNQIVGTIFNHSAKDDQSKSKSSNPFSQKNDPKVFCKQKPPIPKKQTTISNPFDPNSQFSPIQFKADNNSLKQIKSISLQAKNSHNSQRSMSKRGSFVDSKNIQKIQGKNVSGMDDPFEHKQNDKVNDSLQLHKKKQREQKNIKCYDFDDFINVSKKSESILSIQKKQQQINNINQSNFNFSDFENINKITNNNNSKYSDFFKQILKQDQNNTDNKQINSNNIHKQQLNFNKNNIIQNLSNKSIEKNKQSQNKVSTQGQQYGFDDFPNANQSGSQSSKNQQRKNTLTQFQQHKIKHNQKIAQEQWGKFTNVQKIDEVGEFMGKSIQQSKYEDSECQQYEANKKPSASPEIQNPQQKREASNSSKCQNELANQSRVQKNAVHLSQQKSLTLLFQQLSPFQKKQILWDFPLANFSNIGKTNQIVNDIRNKKQLLIEIEKRNNQKINRFKIVNDKLNQIKKIYKNKLDQINQVKLQKYQYQNIYNKLQEGNSIKQKQILQLIKKNQKCNTIKYRIIQYQKILFNNIRSQSKNKQTKQNYIELQEKGNKYLRFDKNLQKHKKSISFQKSVQHFSCQQKILT